MDKIINVACLLVWIFNLVVNIISFINNGTVSPVASLCAILICILYYAEETLESFY